MLYIYDNKNLTFKKLKVKQYLTGFFLLFFIFISLGFSKIIKFNYFIEKIPVVIRVDDEIPTEFNIRKEIKRLNLKYENIIIAQYKLETGNGTSQIYKLNNNLFGMKKAYSRPSTCIKENLGHAYYDNWKESIIDYAFWQISMTKNIKNEKEYLQLLDEIYSEVDDYSLRLKPYINNLISEYN